MILQIETLQAELLAAGMGPVQPVALEYLAPSRAFLETECAEWLNANRPDEYADIDKFNCL